MTRRREIDRQLHALDEIREILEAMKNLALMETHKLTRFLLTQRRVAETVEAALADLLAFHPNLRASADGTREVSVLVGSERGFCGDLNEVIVERAARLGEGKETPALVTVGYRLSTRLAEDPRVVARVAGATVVEEVEGVLTRLLDALVEVGGPPRLTVFLGAPETRGVEARVVDPFAAAGSETRRASPPVLYLAPDELFPQLVHHYLDAALRGALYSSLMAENQRRLRHMEDAIGHIDRESSGLRLRRNALRQEEITEEIELILLTAESLLKP